ncbi:rRNA-processing protein UTP23-like protein [Bienertia sinuspersici]
MRFKKQKRHRKVVRFYTACFGFREPFKVLCDGTFVHHLVSNHLSPESSVSNTLGASVQLFTTKCVIEELKSLGSSHTKSFHAARKDYKLARCEHEQKESALNCILDIIGANNPEHFFVATQDIDLRKRCRKIPGVPVMFSLRNAVFLEQLSSFQREFVKAAEEERLHITDSEHKLLQKRVKSILNAEELKDSTAEEGTADEELRGQILASRLHKKTDVKDKVQFKRKRAKGPNPLSCKPKKNISKGSNTDQGIDRPSG